MKLNTYYSSSEFQGLSGTQVSREGYVPKAEPGDEEKYLKADGTWQNPITIPLSSLDDKEFAVAMSIGLS